MWDLGPHSSGCEEVKEISRLHCGEDHSVWKQRRGVSPSEKTESEVGPSNQSLWVTPHPKQQQIHLLQVQRQGQSHGGETVSSLLWSEPPGLLQEDPLEATRLQDHKHALHEMGRNTALS